MPIIHSPLPLLAVLVSALAVVPIILSRSRPNLREGWTFAAALLQLGLVLSMLPQVSAGHLIEITFMRIVPGVPIQFRVDQLGMLFALVASSLWLVTSIYSIGYMRGLKEHSQTRFFCFFALALSATLGIAFAANLLTLYLFYELLSMSTYPLVTHHQDKEAQGAGRKYLSYLLGSSIALVLPAMILIYTRTGTLDFSLQGVLGSEVSGFQGLVLLLMLTFGFAKSGLMPFHGWLPGAMVAPTPVSALLHAVAVVKAGVFCILRVITGIFGIQWLQQQNLGTVIAWIAAFTVLTSSLIALTQDNLKRRLAFSTIGQLAYIVLGAALLAPKAVAGSMLHLGMHAFGKITLFFCAGAIFVATGKKYISEMVGIGKRMPITMLAFLIGALSVIGLPPAGGFISKWMMVTGAVESGQTALMVVYLISSFLNAAYFFPIVYQAFFCSEEASLFEAKVQEAPRWCLVPPVITALVSILLFFQHQFLVDLVAPIAGMK